MDVSPREIPIASRLYRTFTGALPVLPLVFVLAFMLSIGYEWREYQQAERAVAVNYLIDDLMRVTRHAGLERDRILSLLGNAETIGPADRVFIDLQRKNIDSAWDGVVDAIPRHDIPGAEEILRRAQGIRSALREIYATTDIALSKPLAERPPKLAETWISTMRQLLAHAEELLDLCARKTAFSDGVAGHLLDAKLMAWRLRGSAWTEISALEPIITRAQTPTWREAETIVASAARTALAWEYLSRAVSGFQDRPFHNAQAVARSVYFEDFGRIRDRLLQVAQKGEVPGFDREAYLAVSIRTMESIGSVLDAAMDLTERHALKNRDEARRNLVALTGAMIAGLMLAALIFVVVRWRAIAASGRLQTAGVMADVTGLKDAERRAREAEAKLREITDGVAGAVFRWRIGASGGGSFEFVSKGVEALWGVSRETVERDADSLHGAILEEDRKRMMESIRKSTQALDRWECEFRIRHGAGGELRWIWAEAVPHYREGGEIILNGYWTDITDRKHIEAALKESEERFRQFSESINVGFWILDLNPRCVTYVNRAFTHMSGLEADEVYRNPGPRIDVVHEDDRQAVRLAFEEWLQGGPSSCLEIDYRIVRPDGEMRWIHDHGVKLQDENGQTFRILGISEDITDRKRTDEAIKAMNRALEQKAGELATVNQELEAFAYSVSHDLRAPLRHVDGYISLLQKRVSPLLDETSQRYVATISRAAGRMASLIDDLLAFSRMGRTELNKTVVSLDRLIKDVINDLKTETENRHIDWLVKPLPDVFVDAALFRQAFFNLIENAVKYTRPRPQARIEIGCINEDRNEVIIFVSDNGVGFDMKYVDKLFGVFQRLHRAEEFEGTGIGLANVARIIQRHGGRVWAVGDKDKGATFYVAIPLEEKEK